jgi:hypothetical protein
MRLKDTRLADAVNYLGRVSSLSIVVDPALAMRTGDRPLTLDVQDQPLAEVLNALCREIGGAKYEIKDEIVWITVAR